MRSMKMSGIVAAAAIGVVIGASTVYAVMWPKHPMLQRAQNQLEGAKIALERATHDCGGHRLAAIKLIQQAMQEVEQARDFANAHPEGGKS